MMKKIQINCTGEELVSLAECKPLQGNLKSLSKANYSRLKKQILKHGFCEPLVLWKQGKNTWILNGHQRHRVLTEMIVNEGYEDVAVPAVFVNAKNKSEAKRICLSLASQYGIVESDGLYEFLESEDGLIDDISDYRFPEIEEEKFLEEFYEEPKPQLAGDRADPPDIVECPHCGNKFDRNHD